MNLFMIDIESTGVDQENDDIIEIGIVKMIKSQCGFYVASQLGNYHRILHTNKKPVSKFAIEHMKDLYEKANNACQASASEVRDDIVSWLKLNGATGAKDVMFCGWNSSTFDTPFMVKKGYLIPSGYDADDNQIGDFHYRPYEISGAIELAGDVLGYSRKTVLSMAKDSSDSMDHRFRMLPDGKSHDAIYDCYDQIKMLNGLIKITRG